MNTLKKFIYLLSPEELKRAYILLTAVIFMAIIDVLGVASVLPFMAILVNPDIIETNYAINKIYEASIFFGIKNNQQFIFTLGFFVFFLLVFSLTIKALTTYAQIRFVEMRGYSLSKRLVEFYLKQPYDWFLNRHSADLGKTILSEVSQIIGQGLRPLMELISKGLVSLAIIILLIVVNPKLAIMIGVSLSLAYGLIFFSIEKYLVRLGKNRLNSNQMRYTSVSEALGAIKEIKVGGLEKTYLKRYSGPAKTFAKTSVSSEILGQLPRFALEALIFGGVILLILYLMSQKGSFDSAFPILSLYVFAGYRLMPALQQIYISLTKLRFIGPSLDAVINDLNNITNLNLIENQDFIRLNKSITIKNLYYSYPNTTRPVLNNINVTIPAKTRVGVIGPTGCGKTTIVDIILGLLEPQKGILKIDEQIITKKNSRAWQRSIGYVPQHIYLSDDTIASNIAFGENFEEINQTKVENACRIANLQDFILNELPKKYQTIVGERGVRLSGGQRQRIGIARALYHNPQVLILDEATSALDNMTEQKVMDMIENISKDKTLIIIAHRLNTIKKCDLIVKLNKGEIDFIDNKNQKKIL